MSKDKPMKISKEDIMKAPIGHKSHQSGSGFHEDKKEGRRSNTRRAKINKKLKEWEWIKYQK